MTDLIDIIAGGRKETELLKPEFGMGYVEGSIIPFFIPHPSEELSIVISNFYLKHRGLGSSYILGHPSFGWLGYNAASVAVGSQPFLGDSRGNWTTLTSTAGSYFEGFESSLGSWTNSADAIDGSWKRYTGGTPSSNTGPGSSYEGTYYAYVETSSGSCYNSGDTAIIEYPLDSSSSGHADFYCCMYGITMGSLSLDTYNGTWNNIWKDGGNKGTDWFHATASPFASDTQKVRFKYDKFQTGYTGDVALDIIKIYLDGEGSSFAGGNMVFTNTGKNLVAAFVAGANCDGPSHMALGSMSTTPAATDTELGYEIDGTRASIVTTFITNNTSQSENLLASTDPVTQPVVIKEIGVFTNVSSGSMIARLVFPSFTKDNNIEMQNLIEYVVS